MNNIKSIMLHRYMKRYIIGTTAIGSVISFRLVTKEQKWRKYQLMISEKEPKYIEYNDKYPIMCKSIAVLSIIIQSPVIVPRGIWLGINDIIKSHMK